MFFCLINYVIDIDKQNRTEVTPLFAPSPSLDCRRRRRLAFFSSSLSPFSLVLSLWFFFCFAFALEMNTNEKCDFEKREREERKSASTFEERKRLVVMIVNEKRLGSCLLFRPLNENANLHSISNTT